MNIFLGSIAGFLSGLAGAMGLGGGSVLILYLTLLAGVEQLAAQGINLIFFLPTAAVAVAVYIRRGDIALRQILPIILFGSLGTLCGSMATELFSGDTAGKIFGGFILLYGAIQLFSPAKKQKGSEQKSLPRPKP